MLHLPENFESYNQAGKNGFLKMKELKEAGTPVSISAMCTVFAESEVIGHIGEGKPPGRYRRRSD